MKKLQSSSSGATDLFAVPGSFVSSRAKQICKSARAHFKASRPKASTTLPAAQLRQILHELAPCVREVAGTCYLVSEVQSDCVGNDVDVDRADVPPILAHFAFVALALVEAEARESEARG